MELVVFTVFWGGLVMLAMWPRHRAGCALLRRWSVAGPDHEQIAVAARYLRDRRLPIVPLVLVAQPVAGAVGVRVGDYNPTNPVPVLGSVLVALLLAEWLAGMRRPRGTTRTAPLVRRQVRHLLPRYAGWLHAALTVTAVGAALAGLAAQPAVDRLLDQLPANTSGTDQSGLVLRDSYRAELATSVGWPLLLGTALVALVVWAAVWRAVTRPATQDERVDLVLRMRSVRVAAGIGIALSGLLSVAAISRLTAVTSFLRGHPVNGDALVGTYPVGGPAFPTGVGALPGWLAAWPGLGGPLSLLAALAGILGWAWVANPPTRRRVPSPA